MFLLIRKVNFPKPWHSCEPDTSENLILLSSVAVIVGLCPSMHACYAASCITLLGLNEATVTFWHRSSREAYSEMS